MIANDVLCLVVLQLIAYLALLYHKCACLARIMVTWLMPNNQAMFSSFTQSVWLLFAADAGVFLNLCWPPPFFCKKKRDFGLRLASPLSFFWWEGREFCDEFMVSITPPPFFCEKKRGLFYMMSPRHHVRLCIMSYGYQLTFKSRCLARTNFG